MIKSRLFRAISMFVLTLGIVSSAYSATISPTIYGRINDFPLDGIPDLLVPNRLFTVNNSNTIVQSIIEFDLSSTSGSFLGANIGLDVDGIAPNFPRTLDVYGYVGDGVLGFNDWSVGSLITSVNVTAFGSISIDVLTFINGLPMGTTYAGFNLRLPQVESVISFDDSIVTLNLTSVPVPAAVWLFGSGLLGLVGMARRKKAA